MPIDTVSDLTPRVQYVAAAAQTAFDYPFPIFEDSDLVVDVDGVTQVLTTDYTVSGAGDDTGGTVTFGSGMTGDEVVTIYRSMAIERTTDFSQNGAFSSSAFNDELDRITLVQQDLRQQVRRALRFPMTAEATDSETELSPAANWLGKFVFISADGVPEPATSVTTTALTQSTIGTTLWPLSAAEQAAGLTAADILEHYYYGNVMRYGATGDGVTPDATAIQTAVTIGGKVWVPKTANFYLIDADITVGDNVEVWFEEGAVFKASANGRKFFKSTATAYYTTFHNVSLNGNGKTSVVGFEMVNFRRSAGIFNPYITACSIGIHLKQLCWDTVLSNPHITSTTTCIKIEDGSNAVEIIHPALDTYTTGISITTGPTYDVTDNNIVGGYIQNGTDGIVDSAYNTKVTRTYFEGNTDADVEFSGSVMGAASYTSHRAGTGAVAIKGRNSSGVTVFCPSMSASERSTGLYDFDGTNDNCVEYHTTTAGSMNLPLGTMTGLTSLPIQEKGTFTPVIEGASAAGTGTYSSQYGSYTRTGNVVTFSAAVVWTNHTGTGNIVLSGLPTSLTPTNFTPRRVVTAIPVGFSTFTGPLAYGYLNGSTTKISLVEVLADGSEAGVVMDTAATLYVSGSYEITGDT